MKPHQTLARRLAGLLLAVLTLVAEPARGESKYLFSLEEAVDSAELIVLGQLDPTGSLSIREVLEGDEPKGAVRMHAGDSMARGLQKATGVEGAVEVVAFLGKPDKGLAIPPRGILGFAALKGDAVLTPGERGIRGGEEAAPTYTRETLLAGIRAALVLKRERIRIVALPRGPERLLAMISFLRERVAEGKAAPQEERLESVHLRAFAMALKDPTPAETSAFVVALRGEVEPIEKIELVKLAGMIPLGPEGFATVAPLLDREAPAVVRRAAMAALPRMDQPRAVEVLIPLLSLDEPELRTVLAGFGSHSFPSKDQWLDLRAVDALERLALEMRKQHATLGRNVLVNEGYALLHQLGHYHHPRLVAILVEWGLEGDSAQALSEVRSVANLTFAHEDKDAWRTWWNGAQPLLAPAYTLTDTPGLEQWLAAWTKADAATRIFLMRLWNYETQLDWEGLLKVAERSEPARQVLAELWRSERMPPEAKKAVIERFLSVKLVEKVSHSGHPDIREIAVELSSAFPFPASAWVHCACNITVGDREPVLKEGDSASSFSLHDLAKFTSASMGGGSYPGRPTARALYELREEVPSGRKDGWKMRWALTLELRDSRK